MTVLIDTNVVLDVLLGRPPFAARSARVFDLADAARIRGLLGATTVATVFYLAAKARGRPTAREVTRDLPSPDYEDAVLHEAGVRAGAHAIVTRDGASFAGLALPLFTPDEFLAWIGPG
jgi:predicted nucleic acid-binding protein